MKLTNELIKVLNEEPARDLFIEYGEKAIDGIFDNELIDEIPVLGTLTKGGKLIMSFRDRQLVSKLLVFLKQVEDIGEAERAEFFESLGSDKEKIRTGERLFTLLDRIESEEKSKLVGQLFRKRILGKLSESYFVCMANAIEKTNILDLSILMHSARAKTIHGKVGNFSDEDAEIFVPFRMIKRTFSIEHKADFSHEPDFVSKDDLERRNIDVNYELTRIGRIFVNEIEAAFSSNRKEQETEELGPQTE